MKKNIEHLHSISNKDSRNVIGLMSGTSLDGLDIAYCTIKGSGRSTEVKLNNFITIPYDDAFRSEVRKIFSVKEGNIELLVMLHSYIGNLHGSYINMALSDWSIDKNDVDIIASHGQTIYHAPAFLHKNEKYDNATLQIGDGDHIAVSTGITTIADFRLKHIAAGGEGAPLAVYGDYLIFSNAEENRVMLNIGGIANFTWLPSAKKESTHPCFSTDIGSGNTMMDAYVQKYISGFACDLDGQFAKKGKVNTTLLAALSNNDFFDKNIPKTIGPELFNLAYLEKAISLSNVVLSHEDILATLNKFSADSITNAILKYVPQDEPYVIYGSGGGIHNPVLMGHIKDRLNDQVIKNTMDLGINSDAKEAVLFAILANECLTGDGMGLKHSLNGVPDVSMGKICFPN
jgi:anhydro-N-acetylmuramic acid kinase